MAPILECRNLTKKYGETAAVSGLNLSVEPGRILGVFGPEGSGKTTLLKTAAGMLSFDEGEVTIDGKAPGVETKRITVFFPEEESFETRLYVRDYIRFYRDFFYDFNEDRAVSALSELGIETKDKIADLSKSSVLKLRVAVAMSRNAKLFLLDEPVRGADTATLGYVLNTIVSNRPEDSAVIITSRSPSDVERIIHDAAFISSGSITLFEDAEKLRVEKGESVNALFTEEFKC